MLELGDFRRVMVRHLADDADGFTPRDKALVAAFDEPFRELSRLTRVKRAFFAVLKNGRSRYTEGLANDAGITLVINSQNQLADVIPFPGTGTTPEAA